MPTYTEYKATVEKIRTLLVEDAIKKIAFEIFEQENGYSVRETLPGDNEHFQFSRNEITGVIDTEKRTIYNVCLNNYRLSLNNIVANPFGIQGAGKSVYDAWEDTFGEILMRQQPNHPGEPPFSVEGFEHMVDQLITSWQELCEDPTVDDLIAAIQDENHKLAMRFLGAENPNQVLDPGAGHELYNLFSNGDIHIVYHGDEIALLKPEYDHEMRRDVIEQQRNANRVGRFGVRRRVILDGEQPEEAFVVGIDDTPTGLFIHSIDGTRLDPNQDVSKSYIQDVMGFDRSYDGERRLEMNIGERVRLQGDLAIEYVSGESVSTAGRCPVPIDNHYAAFDAAVIPADETKDVEPIRVQVPDGAYINIAHDEHKEVATELAGGTYELYLLPRGLQPEDERPDWEPREMKQSALA